MIYSTGFNLILAIIVVVLLIIIFFVTYIFNHRTPVPEGCEEARINAASCSACGNLDCEHHIDLTKIQKEIDEEKVEENK